MSKKTLGDNPFEPAAPAPDAARGPDRGDTRDEPPHHIDDIDQPHDMIDEPAPHTGGRAASAAEAIPDADEPDMFWDGGAEADDVFLGGEAAVPPGEYGPPIHSVLPTPIESTSEFRELERRMRAQVTPAFPIEHGRRLLPMEFLWKRYRRFAMRNRSAQVDDFGRDPVYAARLEGLLDFLYVRYFRVETSGIEHVPARGRALLVANHSGMLPYDGTMVMHAVHREHPARRDVRPLFEDFVFHFPYLGTFINRLGGVRASQSNAERLLGRDEVIVVFPEGLKGVSKLYRQRYQLQRFGRGGFIKLALRTRSPVVPVAILGAEEAHPMLAKITWPSGAVDLPYLPVTPTFPLLGPLGLVPVPSKWYIRFGEPIDLPGEYGPEAASDRILVNKLADTVRSRIQGMVDALRTQRKSVVFG
ncbi:MAG TPA: lysophospholipid acyltransferase family protein [Haliangium sp.]|nr:lysophospholipid acyltransferase family protein [Haliangium sp.]